MHVCMASVFRLCEDDMPHVPFVAAVVPYLWHCACGLIADRKLVG
jgi:hypothetical protein